MFQKDWRNIKLDKNLHWYELCFYGDEDSESKNYVAEKACSFVIKTEIEPVISDDVALKILFGEYPTEDEIDLINHCTCVMEVSEDEANFFDIEGLTKRIENEYGIYYVRA
jgi:hypothetical protein